MFAIIEHLAEHEDGGVTAIAEETGISKSTVHHHLSSCLDQEFVVKEDGEYRLGLRCYDMAVRVKQENKLYQRGGDVLENLAEDVNEVGWLVVEEHGRAISLHKAEGESAIQTLGRLGKRTHLHYHAAGKAILANLPQEERDAIVDRYGLPKRTEHTITDPAELELHLSEVREQGYAVHEDEAVIGARAVGAPIIVDEAVIGSVSVAGPANRIQNERLHDILPEKVMGAANEIGLKYSYEK
jgi:DNA-binding IclR family transcriptional regulator